jgi:beta-lactamase class A
VPEPMTPLALLERSLRMLSGSVSADWGIYIRFIDRGDEIAINADIKIDTMSTIKVPILVALMRRVERGEVDLRRRVTLADDHKRLGTGIFRLFDEGATFTLHDAARMMIVVSDNTATDLCVEACGGFEAVNACMRELGIDGIEMLGTALTWFKALAGSMDPELARISPGELVRRGYPQLGPAGIADARAEYHFGGGQPLGLATARGLGQLLLQIQEDRCGSGVTCAEIRKILLGQQMREGIPRYIWGAQVANKTGNFEPFIASDIGIVTPATGSPVVMCFLNQRHRGTRSQLEDCVARMSELVVTVAQQLS